MPDPEKVVQVIADMGGAILRDRDEWERYVENGPDPDYWKKMDPRQRPVRIYHRADRSGKGLAACGARVLGKRCVYFNSEYAARLFGFQKCMECPWD
jgi:hypothetical protein